MLPPAPPKAPPRERIVLTAAQKGEVLPKPPETDRSRSPAAASLGGTGSPQVQPEQPKEGQPKGEVLPADQEELQPDSSTESTGAPLPASSSGTTPWQRRVRLRAANRPAEDEPFPLRLSISPEGVTALACCRSPSDLNGGLPLLFQPLPSLPMASGNHLLPRNSKERNAVYHECESFRAKQRGTSSTSQPSLPDKETTHAGVGGLGLSLGFRLCLGHRQDTRMGRNTLPEERSQQRGPLMRRIGFRLRASSLIETVGDGGTPISFQLGWCRWCSNLGLNSFTPTRGLSKKETPKVPRPFTLACFVLFVFLGEAHPCEFTFAGLHQLALGRDSNGVRGGTFGALPSLSSILDNMRRVRGLALPPFLCTGG